MTSLARPGLHNYLANNFYNNIFFNGNKLHYFIGKIQDSASGSGESFAYQIDTQVRENLLYIKKIFGNDISLVCKANYWDPKASSKVFSQWDHTVDFSKNPNFYVYTDEHNVYKCLNNNHGAESTDMPVKNPLSDVIETSDGYIWKYMYHIPDIKWRKFVNSNYIPVQRAATDSFYNSGSIESITVLKSGSGYDFTAYTKLSINRISPPHVGDIDCKPSVAVVDGSITGISFNEDNYGYYLPKLYAQEGQGASFNITFVDTEGGYQKVGGVGIVTSGFDYRQTTADDPIVATVELAEGEEGKHPLAKVNLMTDSYGRIVSANVTDAGSNYLPTNKYKLVFEQGSGFSANLKTTTTYTSQGEVELEDTIYDVDIINHGKNYSGKTKLVVGEPDIQPTCKIIVSDSRISSIEVIDSGNMRFTSPEYTTVTIKNYASTSPTKAAVIKAVIENGKIVGFDVKDGGQGYFLNQCRVECKRSDANDLYSGKGAEFTYTLESSTGEIKTVGITNGGSGYLTKANLEDKAGTGKGKYDGNTTAKITASIANGRVQRISIEDPGVDYRSSTSVKLQVSGDGKGCEASPIIDDGRIVGVSVIDGGVGYTYAAVSAISDKGSGAEFSVDIGGATIDSDQLIVEQAASINRGSIYAVVVTEGGTGYVASRTGITIRGDGRGCVCDPVVEDGKIVAINIHSGPDGTRYFGSGYSYANVVIVRYNEAGEEISTPSGEKDASAYAILPPQGGHGSNAPEELNGNVLSIYTLLKGNEKLLGLNQEYRQFGIISNVQESTTFDKTSELENLVTFKLVARKVIMSEDLVSSTDEGIPDLAEDDLVTILLDNNGIRHRIVKVDHDSVTGLYNIEVQQLSDKYYNIVEGDPLTNYYRLDGSSKKHVVEFDGKEIEGNNYEIKSIEKIPSVDKYSGDIIFVKNLNPFYISTTKMVGLRTYITF